MIIMLLPKGGLLISYMRSIHSSASRRCHLLRCKRWIIETSLTIIFRVSELPVSSPLIHGVIRVVAQWQELLKEELEARGPVPVDYVPGCYVEQGSPGPALNKYKSLLEKGNTPFQ